MDQRDPEELRRHAARCRELANAGGGLVAAMLIELAEDYEEEARRIEKGRAPPPARPD